MDEFYIREPDPLEELLAPPAPGDPAGLRDWLRERTTRLLRRRRRLRLLARAAALAACFAAGLVAMYALVPRPPALPRQEDTPRAEAPAPPPPEPAPAAAPALALEWRAFDTPDRGAELYRQAGDRYLRDEADPAAALRCYGNALGAAPAAGLTISDQDSWLLMAIKDARQRERHDANRTN
jgi:hypothetical protein